MERRIQEDGPRITSSGVPEGSVLKSENQKLAQKAIADTKSKVCAEFEKVCQTDKALKRMVKEMHNIFDKLEKDIEEIVE